MSPNIFQLVRDGDIDRVIAHIGVNGGLSLAELQKESNEISKETWIRDESTFEEDIPKTLTDNLLSPFGNYEEFQPSIEQKPESSVQLSFLTNLSVPDALLPIDMARDDAMSIINGEENPAQTNMMFKHIFEYLNGHRNMFVRKIGELASNLKKPAQVIVFLAAVVCIFGGAMDSEHYNWGGVILFMAKSFINTMGAMSGHFLQAVQFLTTYVAAPIAGVFTSALATSLADAFMALTGMLKHQAFEGRGLLPTMAAYFSTAVFVTLLLRATHYFRARKQMRQRRKFGMRIVNQMT